tara:strand:+ start:44274 stop:44453 length:180 start_codon:yes stop_codon:yes gene_type:complete
MEVFLGVLCVILLFVAYETLKLKQKQKENERRRKQRKAGSPRKGNRKANRTGGKATNSK